jgi:hypothetical protein
MAETSDPNIGPQAAVEKLTRGDLLYQILCGVGIASGLALLWTMESMRNVLFHGLNALHIRPRRGRRGTAFPAGEPRP